MIVGTTRGGKQAHRHFIARRRCTTQFLFIPQSKVPWKTECWSPMAMIFVASIMICWLRRIGRNPGQLCKTRLTNLDLKLTDYVIQFPIPRNRKQCPEAQRSNLIIMLKIVLHWFCISICGVVINHTAFYENLSLQQRKKYMCIFT